jgi:predicted peroxiredoxin
MSNQVRVIDVLSNTTLFETSLDKISDAYSFATQMEEAGLDIEVVAPGLAETLITALGANKKEVDEFKQSLQEEMDEHDDSDFGCAVCPPGPHK